jgi:predicted nuclease with TOPRIM domain
VAVLPNGPAPGHKRSHITIHIFDNNEENFEQAAADMTLKRLDGLESILQDRVTVLEGRIDKLEGKLDERFGSLEALLKQLIPTKEISQ